LDQENKNAVNENTRDWYCLRLGCRMACQQRTGHWVGYGQVTVNNNTVKRLLKTFGYQTAEQSVEMSRGVNHTATKFRLSGNVVTVGGTTDGTVNENAIPRLISALRVVMDSFDVFSAMDGVDLLRIYRRTASKITEPTTLVAGAAGTTPFAFNFVIPWSWKFYANPYDVFLPARNIAQTLAILVSFPTDIRAALFTGSDRTVTLTNVALDIIEEYSQSNVQPLYVPVFSVGQTEQFAAANVSLEYLQKSARPLAAQLVSFRNGPLGVSQDGINSISLSAGNVSKYEKVPFPIFKEEELSLFNGVPASELGQLLLPYVDNGKLMQAYNPASQGNQPKLVFDVDAPNTGPGQIRVINFELLSQTGITRAS
jgi:hypothetical protein